MESKIRKLKRINIAAKIVASIVIAVDFVFVMKFHPDEMWWRWLCYGAIYITTYVIAELVESKVRNLIDSGEENSHKEMVVKLRKRKFAVYLIISIIGFAGLSYCTKIGKDSIGSIWLCYSIIVANVVTSDYNEKIEQIAG